MVELLINSGADINARGAIRDYQRVATAESRAKSLDRGGFTPLLYAARENCRECAEILLKHGADVNKPDPSGVSPLVIAMMNSNWDIAKRLVEAGADVNQWDMYGLSPLAVAIGSMNSANGRNPLDDDRPNTATGPELVQMLIERGANPNQQTYFRPGTGARRRRWPRLDAVHGCRSAPATSIWSSSCWPRAPIPGLPRPKVRARSSSPCRYVAVVAAAAAASAVADLAAAAVAAAVSVAALRVEPLRRRPGRCASRCRCPG